MPQKSSGSSSIRDQQTGDTAKVSSNSANIPSLHVLSEITGVSAIPSISVIHLQEYLKNGSNTNMRVNGSSTNQTFTFANNTAQTLILKSIGFLIADNGSMDINKFGALNRLNNGLRLEIRTNGQDFNLFDFKNNLEINNFFNGIGSGSSVGYSENSGWFDDSDVFYGGKVFSPEIKLIQDDFVRFTVRDNLKKIDFLYGIVDYWRVL